MKQFKLLFLLLFTIFLIADPSSAQETNSLKAPKNNQDAKVIKNPELREELLKRLNAAVAARGQLSKQNGGVIPTTDAAAVMKTDRENTVWLKSEIEKRGWLGTRLVGDDGEKAAFRLALVAIQDQEFQKRCLELLRQAVKNGEAPAEQVERLAEMINQTGGLSLPTFSGNAAAQKAIVPGQPNADNPIEPVKNPKLRNELLERMKNDQTIRMEAAGHPSGQPLPKELVERFRAIDKENTVWMKKIVSQFGYPGFSSVGGDGEQAAFLMIQHADAEFQKQALELIRRAVEQKDASPVSLAYLTDRVLTVEGKPQIYGTQMRVNNGKPEPFPIEDEANVDKRRAEIGLPALAEYLKVIRSRNQKPN